MSSDFRRWLTLIETVTMLGEGTSLETVLSWMTDEPFTPPHTLYHLTLRRNLPMIQKQGLMPRRPKPSGGKGEDFAGVWLTTLDSVDDIVDAHFLPKAYYKEGVILAVDTSALNPEKFVVGIEMPLGVRQISRSDYLERTNEIIYLDGIPASALREAD